MLDGCLFTLSRRQGNDIAKRLSMSFAAVPMLIFVLWSFAIFSCDVTEADLMVLAGMADGFDLCVMSKDMELSLRRQLRYDSNPSSTLQYHMYLLARLEQSV